MSARKQHLVHLIEGFRLACQAEGKSPRTIEWYHSFLLSFAQYAKAEGLPESVADITRRHIRDYIAHLQTVPNRNDGHKRLSPATVQGHVRTLKAFFSWLLREEYLDGNVLEKIPLPRAPVKIVATFSQEALYRMMRCCPTASENGPRDLLTLFLLLDTGIRVSELINIKLSDVDLEQGYIKITQGKGSRERLVPMGSMLKKHLWKYLSHGRPDPAIGKIDNLLLSKNGFPLCKNGIQQMLRRWGRRAELAGIANALRRAKRARVSFEGEDIKTLTLDTELIRYKWVSTTGKFPDWEKLIPTEASTTAHFDTVEAIKAINSLAALADNKSYPIDITLDNGAIVMASPDDKGQASIPADMTGEPVRVRLDGGYLAEALKACGGMPELKLASASSPVLFTTNGYRLVVMPMLTTEARKEAKEASEAVTEAEAVTDEVGQGEADEVAEPVVEPVAEKPKGKRSRAREPVTA